MSDKPFTYNSAWEDGAAYTKKYLQPELDRLRQRKIEAVRVEGRP